MYVYVLTDPYPYLTIKQWKKRSAIGPASFIEEIYMYQRHHDVHVHAWLHYVEYHSM